MDCQNVEKLLPDYLQRSLSVDDTRMVEQHLRDCVACREEVELWNGLAAVPQEQPSPMLRRNFEMMMEAYQQGRSRQVGRATTSPWHWLRGFVPAAAALALLVVGFVAGLYIDRNRANSEDIASLRHELTSTRQLVALSMLQQQSASDRLQGVSWSRRIESADPQVLDALMHTLRYDNSVDVRLAALDALRRYTDQEPIRARVEDSFSHQQSPLVQIALVDLMVDLRDPAAVPKLKAIQQMPDLNPTVRQRVDWGIHQLSRG